jgi:hypothetical protein
MTQELYQKAIKFAGEKHKNQKVPGTEANYLLHISNVAMEIIFAYKENDNFDIDFAVQVALLHDTLEDTTTEFTELVEKFGEKIAIGVQALTKDESLISKKEKMADTYAWKAAYLTQPSIFEIYIAYPLRSSENYTLKFFYYSATDEREMDALKTAIHTNLETYLKANFEVSRKGVKTLVSQKAMLLQLNEIVSQGLSNYTHQLDQDFMGFSDVVKQK